MTTSNMAKEKMDIFAGDNQRIYEDLWLHYNSFKVLGFNPKTALDVGAAWGQWTFTLKKVFPELIITQVEPDDRAYYVLSQVNGHCDVTELHKVALSDSVGTAEFHRTPGYDIKCVGNGSLHREITGYGDMMETVTVPVETLAHLFGDRTFDLIKLDTQGTEWEIIHGGIDLIKRAEFVQLELSLVEYNKNDRLFAEYIILMKELGFNPINFPQIHYWANMPRYPEGRFQIQADVIFQNERHPNFTDYSKKYLLR